MRHSWRPLKEAVPLAASSSPRQWRMQERLWRNSACGVVNPGQQTGCTLALCSARAVGGICTSYSACVPAYSARSCWRRHTGR